MGNCLAHVRHVRKGKGGREDNAVDKHPSFTSASKSIFRKDGANSPQPSGSEVNGQHSPAPGNTNNRSSHDPVKICVTEASCQSVSHAEEPSDEAPSLEADSRKTDLTLSRHASIKLATNIRGSIRHRKVLRRPSDFSDLAHLEKASEGFKLDDRDKTLLRNSYPLQNSKERSKMISRLSSRIMSLANDSQLSYFIAKRKRGPKIRKNPSLDVSGSFDSSSSVGRKSDPEVTTSNICLQESSAAPESSAEAYLYSHSSQIINVLDMAISSLDHLDDSLGSYLTDMGVHHAQMGSSNFPLELWELIALALCDCATTWKVGSDRVDTFVAWRIVVFFIINRIRSGYEVAKQEKTESKENV